MDHEFQDSGDNGAECHFLSRRSRSGSADGGKLSGDYPRTSRYTGVLDQNSIGVEAASFSARKCSSRPAGHDETDGRENHHMKRMLFIVGVIVAAVSPNAQSPKPAAGTWTATRTPDGHPDLQGIWTTHTFTPLVRPARYAGQEFLTEQEAAELSALLTQDDVDPLAAGIFGASDEERRKRVVQNDPTHYDNALWLATPDLKPLSSNRTSLIYDPPDGKIPPMTPDARQRAAARRAAAGFDSYENRPLQERCIMWTHEGPPMLPPPYNDVLQIIQTPGYVLVIRELETAPRLIPTDGRPHVSEDIRQWAGDSRGRWEGDTLVVDTTNFTDKTAFQGSSSALHVVERFTRVSADRILYQFTVDDPNTWTRPWSAEIPMTATKGPLYEYACHEGNYGMPDILRGARFAEKEAAQGAALDPRQ